MTVSAAFAKLSYVLSKREWSQRRKLTEIRQNLRGEFTHEDKKAFSSMRKHEEFQLIKRFLRNGFNASSP